MERFKESTFFQDMQCRKLLVTIPDEIVVKDDGRVCEDFESVLSDYCRYLENLFSEIEICCWSDRNRERLTWNEHSITTVYDTADYHRALFGHKTAVKIMEDCVRRADLILIVGPCRLGRLAAKFCRRSNKPYVIDITRDYRAAMQGIGLVERLHSIVLSKQLRELTRTAKLVWEK